MQALDFEEVLNRIVEKDTRYCPDAYLFLKEGLAHTQAKLCQGNPLEMRHISGQELLEGLREYGLDQFGPMTLMVLNEWGVQSCEDFGEIVFNMVEAGLLRKTEQDSREDFKGGFDFTEAFYKPFTPQGQQARMEAPPRANIKPV
jgi:uncharacterized repeat protein (TIGR04138 family)